MAGTRSLAIACLALVAALTLATPPAVQLLVGLPLAIAALALWALRPFEVLTRH